MARPDYAFATTRHTYFREEEAGVYRAEPGGLRITLSLERQSVPEALLDAALERAVTAWVLARGGRRLRLNGRERDIGPADLDRLPAGSAQRVVSIAPSNTEIVGALEATDLLVGVDAGSDHPPGIRALPRLGPELNVDLKALAALKPDLVLASISVPGMERGIAGLDALGVPIQVLGPTRLGGIQEDVRRVGRVIARPERAEAVIADMERRVSSLGAGRKTRDPVRVYLEWWPKPMISPTGGCWSNELIRLAGGRNVFGALPGQSAEVSPEQVLAADPEVILISWCGVPFGKLNVECVLNRPGLEGVSAVRNRRVYAVDEALLGRPGPRVVEGVAAIAEAIGAASGLRRPAVPDDRETPRC